MLVDLHRAVTGLRAAEKRYEPHARRSGMLNRLQTAQELLTSLPAEMLGAPVQRAVSELVPVTDEPSRDWRGAVISYLVLLNVERSEWAYAGFTESVPVA